MLASPLLQGAGGIGQFRQQGDTGLRCQAADAAATDPQPGCRRQGLAQGIEGEAEELAGALAGDAELEAGVAQLGFVEGEGGGGFAQAEVQMDDVGEARRQEDAKPFGQGQARGAALAGGAAPGGDAAERAPSCSLCIHSISPLTAFSATTARRVPPVV